jgi:Fe2+ transport system protein FeoA
VCSNHALEKDEECLALARKGDMCEIKGFCRCCDRTSARRLMEYGFYKGRTIEIIDNVDEGNLTVDLDGSRLCLCSSLSEKINIKSCGKRRQHRGGRQK